MAKKGYKNVPGIPEIWDEVKKKFHYSLTPTAHLKLDELAKTYGLSRSEFIEQVARGIIPVGSRTVEEAGADESDRSNEVEDASQVELAA